MWCKNRSALEWTLASVPCYSNWKRCGKPPFLPGEPSSNRFQIHKTPHLSLLSFLCQAVDDLLIGGANPNIPLGQRVGSALCAVVNIHYQLCRDRAKLVKAFMHAVNTFN